jgi:hypothetical protein
LLRNHLHRVFPFDDDRLTCSGRGSMDRGWRSIRGCGGVSSIVVILILFFLVNIFSHPVKSSLPGDLHNELVARLDHSL